MPELEISRSTTTSTMPANLVTRGNLVYDDVLYVVRNMREKDRQEIMATRFSEEPEDLATDAMMSEKFAWQWMYGINPVGVMGALPLWPGMWSVWMFATDDFPFVSFSMTRFARLVIVPTLRRHAHRVECRTMETHVEAHKWLKFLGGEQESILKNYGKNGENFYIYTLGGNLKNVFLRR